MFRFGAGVSQDLTYTIGWLVFGMLLLAGGMSAVPAALVLEPAPSLASYLIAVSVVVALGKR